MRGPLNRGPLKILYDFLRSLFPAPGLQLTKDRMWRSQSHAIYIYIYIYIHTYIHIHICRSQSHADWCCPRPE